MMAAARERLTTAARERALEGAIGSQIAAQQQQQQQQQLDEQQQHSRFQNPHCITGIFSFNSVSMFC
jgi:hypothetical protein